LEIGTVCFLACHFVDLSRLVATCQSHVKSRSHVKETIPQIRKYLFRDGFGKCRLLEGSVDPFSFYLFHTTKIVARSPWRKAHQSALVYMKTFSTIPYEIVILRFSIISLFMRHDASRASFMKDSQSFLTVSKGNLRSLGNKFGTILPSRRDQEPILSMVPLPLYYRSDDRFVIAFTA
jgi:hypothetical protein